MWCIEDSQGRNNMVTSPLWVSGSLDRLININTYNVWLISVEHTASATA